MVCVGVCGEEEERKAEGVFFLIPKEEKREKKSDCSRNFLIRKLHVI